MPNAAPAQIRSVSVELIRESPFNPRKTFDRDSLRELADSIAEKGVQSPVLLRGRRAA